MNGRQREGEADPGGSEAAHEELALDADIEQAAAQRDAGGDAADKDRRRLQEGAGDPLLIAEGAAQQASSRTRTGLSLTVRMMIAPRSSASRTASAWPESARAGRSSCDLGDRRRAAGPDAAPSGSQALPR